MPRFLILFLATLLLACRAEVPAPRPNIVLISIDTLRSDHLPVYGYDGVDTPAIDAFAREATLFRHAFAHVPMTLPSHASIFTGVIPPAHGVRNNVGYALGEEPVTLAAWLGDAGYDTAGFASAYVLREATGIARGFDHWDAEVEGVGSAEIGSLSRSALETNRRALAWLDGRRAEDPFLLFVHYFEPHAPWDAPASYRAKAASDYDAEIAVADAAFGKLADALRARGVWDDSLVVLLSDHGEGLGDHGEQYHGIFVYREAIQVPLLVKAPGGTAAASVDEPVQLADVFPTIADVVGRPAPAHLDGRSLFRRDGGERPIYAESLLPRIHFGWSALRSIVRGSHHGIEAPTPELYDLARDPAEKKNIVEEERRVFAAMRADLEAIGPGRDAATDVSAEDEAKLAALGYLGGGDGGGSGADPKDHIAEIDRLFRASTLAAEGKPDEAIAILEELVRENPRLTDAWTRLGALHQERGETAAAIAAFRRAIEAAPQLAREHALTLANLYLETGELDLAREHAELGVTAHPGTARVLLAAIAAGDGRLDEALRLLDEAETAANGPLFGLDAIRGDVLARLGRGEEAEAAFARELRNFPENRDAYAKLALLYAATGRLDRARGILEILVRADPSPAARSLAANTLEAVGDAEGAARFR